MLESCLGVGNVGDMALFGRALVATCMERGLEVQPRTLLLLLLLLTGDDLSHSPCGKSSSQIPQAPPDLLQSAVSAMLCHFPCLFSETRPCSRGARPQGIPTPPQPYKIAPRPASAHDRRHRRRRQWRYRRHAWGPRSIRMRLGGIGEWGLRHAHRQPSISCLPLGVDIAVVSKKQQSTIVDLWGLPLPSEPRRSCVLSILERAAPPAESVIWRGLTPGCDVTCHSSRYAGTWGWILAWWIILGKFHFRGSFVTGRRWPVPGLDCGRLGFVGEVCSNRKFNIVDA